MNQFSTKTQNDMNQYLQDACEATVTMKQEGLLPSKLEMEITRLRGDARADILCLGEHLHTLAPDARATAYTMLRLDNPEVFSAFGDVIRGDRLVCVYVREEDRYQDALRNWNGIHLYDPRGEDRSFIFFLANFDGQQSSSWLNINVLRYFYAALHDSMNTGLIYALLIGPSKITLFTFAFDFHSLGRRATATPSIAETLTEDSKPLGLSLPEHKAVEWGGDDVGDLLDDQLVDESHNVELTPTFSECFDWFGVKNGEIYYGDYLDDDYFDRAEPA